MVAGQQQMTLSLSPPCISVTAHLFQREVPKCGCLCILIHKPFG